MVTEEGKMHEPLGFDFRKWFEGILPKLIERSQIVISSGESHIPILILFGYGDDEIVPVAVPDFGSIDSKELVANLHQSMAADVAKFAGVIFLSEVWTVASDSEDELDDYTKNRGEEGISKHPRRTEGMMFNAIHGTEQLMAMCSIDPKTRKLGPPKIMDNMAKNAGMSGRMVVDKPKPQ